MSGSNPLQKARKIPAEGDVFFLDFSLYRTNQALTQAQEPVMDIDTVAGGSLGVYAYAPVAAPPFNMIYDQLTHIYADPGSVVTIGMGGIAYPTNSPGCQLSLSGHLVSPPVV